MIAVVVFVGPTLGSIRVDDLHVSIFIVALTSAIYEVDISGAIDIVRELVAFVVYFNLVSSWSEVPFVTEPIKVLEWAFGTVLILFALSI